MEQRHNKIKVASAILFLFISPSWSYIIPVNTHPAARVNVRRQHLLEYPNSRRFVLTQNLQHDQYLGFSPTLKNQRGYIPYYTTNGQVVLNEVQPPVAPPAPPAAPVAPIVPVHPIIPITTEAPTTLPPTTTAAPTTTPAPTTTAAPPPPPPETPAPVIPEEAPAPVVAAPAPVAVAPAPAAPLPQIVQIQPGAGFPQGIIAVQPIITHGGFLNLGSSQSSLPAQGLANNLFSGPALSFLQALLGQQLPAAAAAVVAPAPEPVIPAAPEPPAPAAPVVIVTEAPPTAAPTTTAAPETPAPTTTVAPAPEVMMVILPPAEVAHPAPEVPAPAPEAPATEAPATEAPAPAHEAPQPDAEQPALPAQPFPEGLYYGDLQGWNFGASLNAEQLSVSDPSRFIINVPEYNLNAENLPKPQEFEGVNTEVNNGAVNGQSDFNVVINHNSGADSSGTSFARFKSLHVNDAQPTIETEQQKIVHTNTYEYGQQIQHEQSLPITLEQNKEAVEAYKKSIEESSGRGWQPLVENHSVGNSGAQFDFGYAANNHFVRQGRKYRRRSN